MPRKKVEQTRYPGRAGAPWHHRWLRLMVRASSSLISRFSAHVSSINREARDQFAQRLVQLVSRVVAMPAMSLADIDQQGGQTVEIAGQNLAQDEMFFVMHKRSKVRGLAGELAVKLGQRRLCSRIDKKIVQRDR